MAREERLLYRKADHRNQRHHRDKLVDLAAELTVGSATGTDTADVADNLD